MSNLQQILARYGGALSKEQCINPLAVAVLSLYAIAYSGAFINYLKGKDCNSDLWKYVYSANVVNITVASVALISSLLAYTKASDKCVNLSWWVLIAMLLYMLMTGIGVWVYLGKQEADSMKKWLVGGSLGLILLPLGATAGDYFSKGKILNLFQ